MNEADTQERFMDLVTQHQGRLFGYIYAMVQNVSDTQDLHQQTLMVLWRKFSQYTEDTSFLAWATRIAQIEVLRFRNAQPAGPGCFLAMRCCRRWSRAKLAARPTR